jgi:hypothetical protein
MLMRNKDMQKAIESINFNDRSRLLELIEFTRNSGASYGSTNILEQFIKDAQAFTNFSFTDRNPPTKIKTYGN